MKLRRILRKYIINNIGYKILAVVFSFLLWLVILNITDPEYTRTISNIPVQVVNENLVLDGEHVYTISSGDVTSIILTGKRSIISSLTANDFSVTADFEELSITNAVPIKVALKGDKIRYSNQISMTTRDTSMIISLEEMDSRQIPAELEYAGNPLDNIVIEEANLSPKKVTLYAPQSIIESAEKAVVTVNYADITQDCTVPLTPSIRDKEGALVKESPDMSLDVSEIDVEFKVSGRKNVPLSVTVTGEPADGYTVAGIELSQDMIAVKGPLSEINTLEMVEIPSDLINIWGAAEDVETEVDVTPFLPENMVVYGESPTITVTVRIEPEVSEE